MTSTEIARSSSKIWTQWLAALTIHIFALLCGLVGGWTSPYLAKLTKGAESLTVTNDEASWIASLLHLSRPVGSIFAAAVVHKFGSKKAVLLGGIPFSIAWAFFLVETSVPWIYASRIAGGLAMGIYLSAFPLYIGEIGHPKIRGALIALVAQGSAIGYLMGNLMGAYSDMRTFAIINLILSIIYLFSFSFFPDSPHYFVKNNRMKEAERSLRWYNRQNNVRDELESLKIYMETTQVLSFKQSLQQLITPLNRRILMMVVSVYLFMQLSGINTVAMYQEILLTTLKIDVIAPSLVVVCVGVVAIIGNFMAIYTNDHFGRRSMLAVSTLGVAINFALIGIHYLFFNLDYDVSNVQWLVIVEFMMYIFFLNIGLTHIPSCLLSEIFSPELKEIGSCIANIVCASSAFAASKSYQPLLDATSEEFVFFFYAILVFFMFIYTIMVIPETKGKSLQEIQEMLMKKGTQRFKAEIPPLENNANDASRPLNS
ncbi:facilitated trehalose transporter Tret1 [Fopius arisanus]|uniref:Facilitated trehalose transporter Tret1 n=1 Tax=Fopius arisanus TaxID=64838 RepID=A0A0C9RNL8_9HYME|nr:PREDICTED: facilitated trehalose transporter Tret1-like [Fopius arisanus]